MSLILAAGLLAAQAASGAGDNPLASMQPASAAAIRTGGKACVGATVDPAGQDARLTGWADATPEQKQAVHGEGRVVQRDNVLLIVKPGLDGGCVVMAKVAPDFDRANFVVDLGKDIGKPIVADPKNPVTELGKGEVLVTTLTGAPQAMVVLVVGNRQGKAMKNKGN